ncbi:Tm-1-like ATP-binding domain-containing protein, partial [Serratia marcescens]|nr:Tm-1-like ATP-binding domain-containing protein [Serratia marcescens]
MQQLPIGLPKIMVSAWRRVTFPPMSASDINMLYSVT